MTKPPVQEGKWKRFHVGKNIWKYIYNSGGVNYIAMTGSDVPTQLHVPFPHRFMRFHLYHTDSSDAASNDALSVTIERPAGTVPTLSKFTDQLFKESYIPASKLIEVFGETFEYEECIWSVVLNSTSTDRIYLEIFVQNLRSN